MRHILRAAAALIAISAAAPSLAQDDADDTGFYVSLNAGMAKVNDLNVTYFAPAGTFGGTGSSDTLNFKFDLDSAFAFGGAIGYDFGTIRADVEVSYSRSKASAVTLNSVNGSAVTLTASDRADVCDYLEAASCGGSGNTFTYDGARARQLSAIANLWLDLPVGNGITPYAGGGVGVIGYEVDGEGEARFAWQLGAGVAFDLAKKISLTADYRYRQGSGVTINDGGGYGTKLDDVKTSTLTAGLRIRF